MQRLTTSSGMGFTDMYDRLDMVESFVVCVGPEAKELVLIKSIAKRSSKFFQAAMSRDWKEAFEKRVMLPETEVNVFEGYLQWLYTGHITFTCSIDVEYSAMSTFYILSDFLDDLAFRNAVLNEALAKHGASNELPTPKLFSLLGIRHQPTVFSVSCT